MIETTEVSMPTTRVELVCQMTAVNIRRAFLDEMLKAKRKERTDILEALDENLKQILAIKHERMNLDNELRSAMNN